MQNRGNGHGPVPEMAERRPLLEIIPDGHAAKDLLHTDRFDDFITALRFANQKQALAFAKCIFKCRKHHMVDREKQFKLSALALCAENGQRAAMYGYTLAGVFPEAFGTSKKVEKSGKGIKKKVEEE